MYIYKHVYDNIHTYMNTATHTHRITHTHIHRCTPICTQLHIHTGCFGGKLLPSPRMDERARVTVNVTSNQQPLYSVVHLAHTDPSYSMHIQRAPNGWGGVACLGPAPKDVASSGGAEVAINAIIWF